MTQTTRDIIAFKAIFVLVVLGVLTKYGFTVTNLGLGVGAAIITVAILALLIYIILPC